MTFTRAEVLRLLEQLGEGLAMDLLRRAKQLEPRLRSDPRAESEEMHDATSDALRARGGIRSPSTFEAQAAAVRRSPSGTMAAVRDTEPAPAPKPSER